MYIAPQMPAPMQMSEMKCLIPFMWLTPSCGEWLFIQS